MAVTQICFFVGHRDFSMSKSIWWQDFLKIFDKILVKELQIYSYIIDLRFEYILGS